MRIKIEIPNNFYLWLKGEIEKKNQSTERNKKTKQINKDQNWNKKYKYFFKDENGKKIKFNKSQKTQKNEE